mgnify:CR=1 FL=1
MREQLESIMQEVGDTSGFVSYRPVSGGSIARSFQVTTHNERYFVKCVKGLPSDLFEKEADGLKRLGKAGAFSVPKVYGHARESAARPAWLVLEWIEPGVETDGGERFGVTLAQQHRITAERYGLDTDNYIGSMVQKNGWFEDWVQFYRERRLQVQADWAQKNGRMTGLRQKRMERLLDHLHRWLPQHPPSSLLHGDLWSGNRLVAADGTPYIIDPAVCYGDREMELAFTELFGGFPARFYAAYQEAWPLSPEYEERKPLYQLYYLLVHLNLFGESYGRSVDEILKKYVGE